MMSVVKSTGARLGLAYAFDRVQHTSTFLAHQLLHHAKANGRQLPMLEVLFPRSSSVVVTCARSMSSSRWPVRWI
jgi:predicted DsbA family dithiol-disulfide isomerase